MEKEKEIRILVADDEEPILSICERYLSLSGYKVSLAVNGQDAIQSLIQQDFDLVLTDYIMPDIDGMELIKQIRESKPHIGVVMMTGFSTVELAVSAMKNGADDFVMKPLNFKEISFTLEKVLKSREMSEEVRRLRVINKKQEELEKIKNKFIEITSHELKTPVTSILNFSDLVRELPFELNEEQQEFLGIINQNAQQLNRIVSDMHSCLFDHNLKEHLCIDWFTVKEMVTALVGEFQEVTKDRALQISCDFSDEIDKWQGDAFQLQRALREILGNAIKYTPDGGTIRVNSELLDSELSLGIVDTGIGITQEDQYRIFDRFYEVQDTQYHSTSETAFMGAGTGLGLSVAKSIIDAHDGKISVQSQMNKGTTVTIRLPKSLAINQTSN